MPRTKRLKAQDNMANEGVSKVSVDVISLLRSSWPRAGHLSVITSSTIVLLRFTALHMAPDRLSL